MLSDEEKKAIIELKHYCNLTQYWRNVEYTKPEFDDYITTILNLIEKQSKEIEELKEENEKYKNPPFFDEDEYTENDKIKAKIEWLDKEGYFEFLSNRDILKCHNILASLLERR